MASYIVKNATILDGKLDDSGKMHARKRISVVVRDNVVVKVDKTSQVEQNGDFSNIEQVFDLNGAFLMPGLINMHVHICSSGGAPKSNGKPANYQLLYNLVTKVPGAKSVYLRLQKNFVKSQLLSGVTTLRAVGGINDFDAIVRDSINSGKTIGPRILSCNRGISVPGGHFAGLLATESKNSQEAREDVQNIAKTNPDYIKVMITGGVMDAQVVGEPGILKMDPEIVQAVVDEAHKLGLKTVAHVECTEGVKVALDAGIDFIEHGATLDDELIEQFKKTGAVVTATLSPAVPYAVWDEADSHCGETAHINGQAIMKGMIDCYKQCLANGIPIGLGTDTGCPFVTQYNMWRELAYFQKYLNVDGDLCLNLATLGNAKILGMDDKIGSIEEGKKAEMIVSEHNPLENFANLARLKYVFVNDMVLQDPRPKKMDDCDNLLDKYM